jgi:hypothetical protein
MGHPASLAFLSDLDLAVEDILQAPQRGRSIFMERNESYCSAILSQSFIFSIILA